MDFRTPRLLDLATVSEQSVIGCFHAAANSHLRQAAAADDAPRAVATPAPDGLRAVYAARTSYADALGVRTPNAATTYFTASQRTRASHGYFTSTITAPADDVAATCRHPEVSGAPGGGVSHLFGYARADVAVVLVRTPDGVEHYAPATGGVWWTPALLDEASERAVKDSTWRAVAADGALLAHGGGYGSGHDQ